MDIRNFIEKLRKSHFFLVNDNGQLILRGDKSRLSEQQIRDIRNNREVIDFIRTYKADILDWLSDSRNTLPGTQADNVSAIYPLSSLQEGILFQVLYDGSGSAYVQQARCDFEGLDTAVFRQTWEQLMRTHTILRTGIHHDVFRMPVQTVYNNVPLPLDEIDLRARTAEEQEHAMNEYQERDVQRGFILQDAPLMRIALFRLGERRYRMLWTTHHLILDGWSVQALVAGFLETYAAYLEGAPQETTTDAYEDYIRFIQGQDKDEAIAFWQSYMDGADRGCLLPFVRQQAERTKGVDSFREELLELDEAATAKIQRYVQRNQITLNTLMQGIWATLLTDYTGNAEVLFGVVTHGRPQELKNIEKRVGMYTNILPLRVTLDETASFSSELSRLQRQQLSAQQYQYTALSAIRDLSAVKGELFDTIISFQNFPVSETAGEDEGSFRITNVQVEEQSTNYPLCMRIQAGSAIGIEFIYRESMIAKESIETIVRHFHKALMQVVESDKLVTGAVDPLAESEKAALLQYGRPAAGALPEAKDIVHYFEEQADANPSALAIAYGHRSLTYAELKDRADRVAAWLVAQGVQPGAYVGICMERSDWLIVAILGVLKAGAAYVPFDPSYPADRIAYMIEDSGITRLLATEEPRWHTAAQVLLLNEDTPLPAPSGEGMRIDPSATAYLMYTSGSTGIPKGVLVSHGNVTSLVKNVSYVNLAPGQVLLSSGSPSFDAVTFEYWGMLLNGGRLVMCPEETLLDPVLLKAEMRRQEVTMMWFTAGWFNQLVTADIEIFATLRTALVGGDRLSPQMIGKVRDRYPALQIVNGYGPTENTTFSLSYTIENSTGDDIPIGRPLDNRTAFILSPAGRLTPVGAVGELCVGGAGLAAGYHNRAALTAERFREVPGLGRLYFTGDLAGWTSEGTVRFIGRKDDQVKIRGYRVEPGEIARLLEKVPGVEQALVLVKESAGCSKRLVAYATGSDSLDKTSLLDHLSERLPDYMVPSSLIVLENWPLTPNGKIDRDKLPADEETTTTATDAPMDELQASLSSIWSEVLEMEHPGLHDNFFDLGGHSLLVIRVISALRKELKVELGIRELFDHPTIAGLAEVIRGQLAPAPGKELQAHERPAEIPLSFAQERLWFIDKLQGSLAYHMPWLFDIEGPLDVARLEAAFGTIVQRHEVLRTVLRENEGVGFQMIMPADDWKMSYEKTPADPDAYFRSEISRPFDLSADYMLRASLAALAPGRYRLLIMFHHIAFDGWSISVFVRELVEAYRTGNVQAELPLQYADYAIWQRQHLSGELLRERQAYWQQQLAALEPLQLPTDRPRPAHPDSSGSTVTRHLDKDLHSRLLGLSRGEDATLFMTLLAAFNVLLQRYSGQRDICIGTPVAGRDRQELESLIGFFVNTIPLRSRAGDDHSFRAFLQSVKTATLAAFERQDIPFEKIVEVLDVSRTGQVNPVFQVMFSLQTMPAPADLLLDDISLIPIAREHDTALFDLSLDALAGDDGLHLTMNYSTALFTEATVLRMLRHFEQLLRLVAAQPDTLLARLDMLMPEERMQLLDVFRTAPRLGAAPSFLGRLLHQLRSSGERPAVLYNGQAYSYEALHSLTDRLTASLHQRGVRKGDKVVVKLRRSELLPAAIIALWRCGAVYVPVDIDLPEDRMSYIINDVQPAYIITEELIRKMKDEELSASDVALTPDDEAYIIYTSGSTGLPKGVVIRHGGLDNLFAHIADTYTPAKELCMPFLASPGFDISLFQLFTPLINGGASLIIDKETMQDMDLLVQSLQQATFLDTVPGVFSLIADHIRQNRLEPAFQHVERLFIGGDSIPDDLLQRLALIFTHATITVTYGPTEATIFCTNVSYAPGSMPADVRGAIIGRPLPGVGLYILDSAARLQPVGMEGEICIGGPGVAAGYLNNPALTHEKFIADPYGTGLLYRTGDVGRWLADGSIMFSGRNDRQLKIRGNRIEPGELESRLKGLAGIKETVVQLCNGASAGAQLVAFYTGEKTEREVLAACLRGFLAESVMPNYFIHLQQVPLTSNGKVDHKTLQEIFAKTVAGEAASKYVPAGNEEESMLVEIWEELLQRKPIGIDDNFFELGGHSLLAIRMIAAVRNRCARELHVRQLFDHPTIAALAAQLSTADADVKTPAIRRQQLPDHIPLSFAQERLWFIDQLNGSLQYHMPSHFRLHGTVDKAALEKAFRRVLERHEILRTVIRDREGMGYQLVLPADGWKLDTAGIADEDHFRRIEQTPFHLSSDYMLRATLTTLPGHEYVLSIVLHHIAFDGWSAGILLKELVAFYNDPSASLPPLPIQYADYAVWQRAYLSGAVLESKLAYWKEQLADVEPLELPTDYPRPSEQSIRGAIISALIGGARHEQLMGFCRREDVTVFMTALSVFNVLLHRYTGRRQVCVGTPVAGRDHQELEPLLGFFVNTLAINTELPADISFRALLQRVRQSVIDAYGHQDVPFEKVVEALGLERNMSRNPVFQVMFALQHASDAVVPALGAADAESIRPAAITSLFDLTLNVTVADDALRLDLVYCADLFTEATMQRLLVHYERLLSAALAAPDTAIDDLELLSPEEKKFLLEDMNDTATDYPTDKTLVDLLAEQVLLTPDRIAAEDERTSLTYRELDELSNRFGHYLRDLGVQEETLVPICLDRSVNMIIGILAILKAGGAYVPMDPNYPVERLRYMLSDMHADIVITMNEHAALFGAQQQLLQVRMNDLDELVEGYTAEPLRTGLQPHHAAYMIYTSGSTGQPKGVINEHGGIVNRLLWTQRYFGLGADDAVLQKTTFCFDVSVWELFWPLIAGARLVFARPGGHKDPSYLARLIAEAQVTTIHFVPSMLAAFLEDVGTDNDWRLKRILCSGEALQANHVYKCQQKLPDVKLFNLYGPTEAAVDVTCWDVPAHFTGTVVPIGKPVANTQLYVMDAGGRLVPGGVAGELYIGGVQVARGYHNKPVLTRERFVPDPFRPDATLYRTGDLVRWQPDGNLAYLGRADDQLKIRGYRIEPGEVEAAILASKMVEHAVITARPDVQGALLLVGYIVPAPQFEREEFISYMRKNLPGHMIPSLLVKLDRLPLTVNGKLNRKALPEPNKSELLTGSYVAPRNRTERHLAAICQELIRVEQVGINDNFFEMGGHSIIMMQMINRMKRLGYRVQLKDLFLYQNIGELAAAVGMSDGADETGQVVHDHLVVLHEEANGLPCFIIPGSEGVVNNYDDLAETFGRHRYQVYGIQQKGIYDDETPLESIDAIADFNLQLIRQVQPRGPYRFIGHSMGGMIIYELVKRLEAAGEKVDFALMLDARPYLLGFDDKESAVEYIMNYINDIIGKYRNDPQYPEWKRQIRELLSSTPNEDMGVAATRYIRERIHDALKDINLQLLRLRITNSLQTYRAEGTATTSLVLLNAAEASHNGAEEIRQWLDCVPHLQVFTVPGTHATMIHKEHAASIYTAFEQSMEGVALDINKL